MKGRTSIVVAHRLTTVEKCNRVAVIEDGVVTEEGTFSDLQKNQAGYFQSLENKKWNFLIKCYNEYFLLRVKNSVGVCGDD